MARILVVEDFPLNVELVEEALAEAGHSLSWARDAESAWANLSHDTCDVVILDWHLPGQSGEHLLSQMRARGIAAWCIVLTADVRPQVRTTALRLGANAVLTKPILGRELRAAIAEHLSSS